MSLFLPNVDDSAAVRCRPKQNSTGFRFPGRYPNKTPPNFEFSHQQDGDGRQSSEHVYPRFSNRVVAPTLQKPRPSHFLPFFLLSPFHHLRSKTAPKVPHCFQPILHQSLIIIIVARPSRLHKDQGQLISVFPSFRRRNILKTRSTHLRASGFG